MALAGCVASPAKGDAARATSAYRGLSQAGCATKPYRPGPRPRLGRTWHFASEPGLHPMKVSVLTHRRAVAPGRFLVAPYSLEDSMVGQTGSVILAHSGQPIWFRPLPSTNLMNTDFRTQRLGGKRVLSFWQGTVATSSRESNLPPGYPEPGACWYVLDHRYRRLGTLTPRRGFDADVHELTITPGGTALLMGAKKVPMDLTPYGGPANGFVMDQQVQEIDLRTGKLLFSWDALRHLDLSESELPASSADSSDGYVWDAFHVNSLEPGPNGRLLISARNMWAIYEVKRSGRIVWQLGGKESDFSLAAGANFAWQHMARYRGRHRISMFDDGCCESASTAPEQLSHGLVLKLDRKTMTATRVRAYFHGPRLESSSQGGLQKLARGNALVGWGSEPFFSEYKAAGNSSTHPRRRLVYDARMPGHDISYRTFSEHWTGDPSRPPSVAVRPRHGRSAVYASWNGSTRTAGWRVLAGPRPNSLKVVVRRARRTGFETRIETRARGPYFKARALDSSGHVIGVSRTVRRRPG